MEEYIYHFNIGASLVTATTPFVIGYFWYHPKLFGNYRPNILTKYNRSAVFYILSFALLIAIAYMLDAAIEFSHYHPELDVPTHSDHLFWHGVFHGLWLTGFFVVVPLVLFNALFRKIKWTSLLLNITYIGISISIMSGILDSWN